MKLTALAVGVALLGAACGDDSGTPVGDAAIDRAPADGMVDAAPPDAAPDAAPACSVLAGGSGGGFMDGTGSMAQFNFPQGLAIDSAGTLYLGDYGNHRIRKIAPDGTTTTLAGNGMAGFFDGTGGPTGTTQFNGPAGVAVDSAGNVYTGDFYGARIRKIAPDGTTTTLSGNGMPGDVDGTGGPTGTSQFLYPNHLTVDGAGNVYVISANKVRKVAPDGTSSVLAGNGAGYVDGTGGRNGTTQLNFGGEDVGGLAVDSAGFVYAAEFVNSRIRKIAADGTTTTLAGNGGQNSMDGTGGPTGTAQFYGPFGAALDSTGNLYVADFGSNKIRKVAPDGTTTTIADNCGGMLVNLRGVALRGNTIYVVSGQGRVWAIRLP